VTRLPARADDERRQRRSAGATTARFVAVALAVVLPAVLLPGVVGAQGTPGLAEARARAEAAVRELSAAEDELGELDERIRQSDERAAAAEVAVAGLRAQVRDFAVRRYMQMDQVPVLVDGDLTARERAKVLVASAAGRNLDAVDQYRAERLRLDSARGDLEGARARQEEVLDELVSRRAVLDAELNRLEALESQRLADERAAAERAAAAAAARTPSTTSGTGGGSTGNRGGGNGGGNGGTTGGIPGGTVAPPVTGGAWVCPVQGARSFIDSWMAPRAGGRRHEGVDIMSPRGTPVVTPVAGRLSLTTSGLGGLGFDLDGDDGNYYFGTHLDSYSGVANGWHPAGTLLGYVGDTGDARGTGTHLHFEIHLGGYGNPVNPYPTTRQHC
jgi:peptidoglycan LD-endopeptidase LytH